jgi:hypothetical protein
VNARRPLASAAANPAALALALAAALPVGQALGDWLIIGNAGFGAALSRRWTLVPALAVLIVAGVVVARRARSRLWLAAPVLVVAVLCFSAWHTVAARVEAYREGPLNAGL